jgi:hypothetical protein
MHSAPALLSASIIYFDSNTHRLRSIISMSVKIWRGFSFFLPLPSLPKHFNHKIFVFDNRFVVLPLNDNWYNESNCLLPKLAAIGEERFGIVRPLARHSRVLHAGFALATARPWMNLPTEPTNDVIRAQQWLWILAGMRLCVHQTR